MEQSKALKLADECATGYPLAEDAIAAAAELRRLSAIEAEREALRFEVDRITEACRVHSQSADARRAERDALRAEVERLRAAPAPVAQPLTDEQIDRAVAAERDALLDHIYEHGTTAEGVMVRVRKLARAAMEARGQEGTV